MVNKVLRQKGFTLIELVIVILLIAILAATALPRFTDLSTKARAAAGAGVAGALSAAVAISHAEWLAEKQPAGTSTPITLEGGQSVYMSTTGWPEGTAAVANGTMTAPKCLEIWNGILSNSPIAATGTCTGSCQYLVELGTPTTQCKFTEQGPGGVVITYDIATGAVAF